MRRSLRLSLLGLVLLAVMGQRSALSVDQLMAQIEVSRDLSKVTFRGAAPDTLSICVAPRAGEFGRTFCFKVGDIRAGRVVTK